MPMHHCLRIAEVLEKIFENLERNHAALAAVARTCTMFKETVLEGLRKRQNTLDNILKCLPPDAWELETDYSEPFLNRQQWIRLLRPLELEDWDRPSQVEIIVPLSDLEIIGTLRFPFSDLECLEIGTENCASVEPPPTLLPSIDRGTFHLASYLPMLHCLQLTKQKLSTWNRTSEDKPLAELNPFPSLCVLTLKDTKFEVGVAVLSMLPAWDLEEFLVETFYVPCKDTLQRLYHVVASRLSPDRLSSLHIRKVDYGEEIAVPPPDSVAEYVVLGSDVQPLFRLNNLRDICLETATGFDIDNNTIWQLARALPKLTYLTLISGSEFMTPPCTTLDALRAFAEHCSDLGYLALGVDTARGPASDRTIPLWYLSNLDNIETRDQDRWEDPDAIIQDDDDFDKYHVYCRWAKVKAVFVGKMGGKVLRRTAVGSAGKPQR
ncbi:hypothetical protein C8F01DRAFT_1293133 [Mycena amicta]|nr:hypothetical protein C8F01DRAFT_1293133 [Mycena amicta]